MGAGEWRDPSHQAPSPPSSTSAGSPVGPTGPSLGLCTPSGSVADLTRVKDTPASKTELSPGAGRRARFLRVDFLLISWYVTQTPRRHKSGESFHVLGGLPERPPHCLRCWLVWSRRPCHSSWGMRPTRSDRDCWRRPREVRGHGHPDLSASRGPSLPGASQDHSGPSGEQSRAGEGGQSGVSVHRTRPHVITMKVALQGVGKGG